MSNPVLKYLFTTCVSLTVFFLDQATKFIIFNHIRGKEPVTLIDGFFNISYVTNAGGVFGLFGESHEIIRFILFLFFPIVCVFFIFMMLRETNQKFQILALSFILGGAGGNYLDRVRLGYVIDFIDWHIKEWHWPTFNVADSFILTGISILAFFYFQESRAAKRS